MERKTLTEALATLRSSRVVIDLDAVAANYHYLCERAGRAEVLCVVKANAYGHGAAAVARRLQDEGARWFGVALVEEGIELRRAGVTGRILLLGGAEPQQLADAIAHDLTPSVVSRESLDALTSLGRQLDRPLTVHVKVDTGMARLGIPWAQVPSFARQLTPDLPLKVEGLYTHLACSDDPAVPFTRVQLERFADARAALSLPHLPRPLIHVASSAGLLTRAEGDVDLVRPGLALYGLNPFGNLPAPELTPAMTVSARIVRVERFPAGTAVGYGGTHITLHDATLATLPIGYDDGLVRALSDDWEVAIGDQLVPLVGRISMDLVVADVTGVPGVKVGDEVIFLGGGPGCPAHSTESMAARLKTIPYEVSRGFGRRLPRVFTASGEPVAVQSRFIEVGYGLDDAKARPRGRAAAPATEAAAEGEVSD